MCRSPRTRRNLSFKEQRSAIPESDRRVATRLGHRPVVRAHQHPVIINALCLLLSRGAVGPQCEIRWLHECVVPAAFGSWPWRCTQEGPEHRRTNFVCLVRRVPCNSSWFLSPFAPRKDYKLSPSDAAQTLTKPGFDFASIHCIIALHCTAVVACNETNRSVQTKLFLLSALSPGAEGGIILPWAINLTPSRISAATSSSRRLVTAPDPKDRPVGMAEVVAELEALAQAMPAGSWRGFGELSPPSVERRTWG